MIFDGSGNHSIH